MQQALQFPGTVKVTLIPFH